MTDGSDLAHCKVSNTVLTFKATLIKFEKEMVQMTMMNAYTAYGENQERGKPRNTLGEAFQSHYDDTAYVILSNGLRVNANEFRADPRSFLDN